MKKKLMMLSVLILTVFLLSGCGGEKITLELSFGERTGTYTGDMVDGLPDGEGTFETENEEGDKWTYEGSFKKGHFEGKGVTTWANGDKEIGTYHNDVVVPLSGKELRKVYSNPDDYKNYAVQITGQVFSDPEYDEDGVAFQLFGDPEKSTQSTVVYVNDPDFEVDVDDYITASCIVTGEFTGENALGGEITALQVATRDCKVISYAEAVHPALKTVKVNETASQFGYSITVEKVEFAEKETRVYVKVNNGGSSGFSFFSFDAKLIQGNKQHEPSDDFMADYPEIDDTLAPGVTDEAVIAFPAIEQSDFKLIFDCYSDNFDEELKPFEIPVKL